MTYNLIKNSGFLQNPINHCNIGYTPSIKLEVIANWIDRKYCIFYIRIMDDAYVTTSHKQHSKR